MLKRQSLSDNEWQIVDSLMKILEPIYYSTEILQGLSYHTISQAKIIKQKLLNKYKLLAKSQDQIVKT